MKKEDFMVTDQDCNSIASSSTPSAETKIHLLLYKNPAIHCVLHTHAIPPCVLSILENKSFLEFKNLEIMKAISGTSTHLTEIYLPVFENSQSMDSLCEEISKTKNLFQYFGIILKGHGIYTWGKSIAEAKRHMEAYVYLCELSLALKGKL